MEFMFPHLPEPDRVRLEGSPITVVAFQLDFPAEVELQPRLAKLWRDAMQNLMPIANLQPVQKQNLSLVPGAQPVAHSLVKGWQLAARDESTTAALYADSLQLNTQNYHDWEHFRVSLMQLLEALVRVVDPQLYSRIALRYANALSEPDARTPAFWEDKVRPFYLGPGSDPDVLDALSQSLTYHVFRDEPYVCALRIGIQPDVVYPNAMAFVFDIESALQETATFDMQEILAQSDTLNTNALKLFQHVLTPAYIDSLRVVEHA